jgi:hypothetical protein
MKLRFIKFLGINFILEPYDTIMKYLILKKGYMVIPAASLLTDSYRDNNKLLSLKKSTCAILDSGFFCICLLFFKKIKTKKFSGYKFLFNFLNDNSLKNKKILSLDPSIKELKSNRLLLIKKNFKLIRNYLCPIYNSDNIVDSNLLKLINQYKPEIILTNISGGKQEILALYLKKNIRYKNIIICSGAAISFFTGNQAPITKSIDKYYLGWFLRIIYNPKIFVRLVKSINLILYVINNKVSLYTLKIKL